MLEYMALDPAATARSILVDKLRKGRSSIMGHVAEEVRVSNDEQAVAAQARFVICGLLNMEEWPTPPLYSSNLPTGPIKSFNFWQTITQEWYKTGGMSLLFPARLAEVCSLSLSTCSTPH